MSLILEQARQLAASIERREKAHALSDHWPQPYCIDTTHPNRGAVTLIFNDEETLKKFLGMLKVAP